MDISIRKIKYKDEKLDDINNDILYDFQKKYKKNKLEENEEKYIENFMKNKNKNESYLFLLSLQFIMFNILSKSSNLKNEDDIFDDVIEKMPVANLKPNEKNLYNLAISFFEKNKKNDENEDDDDILGQMNTNANQMNFEIDKKNDEDDDDDILEKMNANANQMNNRVNNEDKFTISKLFNIYEVTKNVYEKKIINLQ